MSGAGLMVGGAVEGMKDRVMDGRWEGKLKDREWQMRKWGRWWAGEK